MKETELNEKVFDLLEKLRVHHKQSNINKFVDEIKKSEEVRGRKDIRSALVGKEVSEWVTTPEIQARIEDSFVKIYRAKKAREKADSGLSVPQLKYLFSEIKEKKKKNIFLNEVEILLNPQPSKEKISNFIEFLTDSYFNDKGNTNRPAASYFTSMLLVSKFPDSYIHFKLTQLHKFLKFFNPEEKLHKSSEYYADLMIRAGKLAKSISSTEISKKYFGGDENDDFIYIGALTGWSDKYLNENNISSGEGTRNGYSGNSDIPLNQILYGPPGTGKTYSTVEYALKILGGSKNKITSIQQLKEEFPNQVEFVTFHQSFSYEDFVEGLKAKTENGQLDYSVEDGVFKEICKNASSQAELKSTDIKLDKKITIWKMSLGNSQTGDADRYFEEALDSNSLVLGWGGLNDFTTCKNKAEILNLDKNGAEFVNLFKFEMKVGDIVVISDGNYKFKAIARIIGDYRYDGSSDLPQKREIEWLQKFSESRPVLDISKKNFTQSTINKPQHINIEKLQDYLQKTEKVDENKKYVLIIDEINRGNISRIFGELITLIEESKRSKRSDDSSDSEEIAVKLPYSKSYFSVPNNLYIIGTMNTADRSLALMDTALRRRFDFIEMMPKISKVPENVEGVNTQLMLEKINQRIEVLYDREHTIGHAFLMKVTTLDGLRQAFKNKILPLLEEYFYDDWQKICFVLADKDENFYEKIESVDDLFHGMEVGANTGDKYRRNETELLIKEALIQIYKRKINKQP